MIGRLAMFSRWLLHWQCDDSRQQFVRLRTPNFVHQIFSTVHTLHTSESLPLQNSKWCFNHHEYIYQINVLQLKWNWIPFSVVPERQRCKMQIATRFKFSISERFMFRQVWSFEQSKLFAAKTSHHRNECLFRVNRLHSNRQKWMRWENWGRREECN